MPISTTNNVVTNKTIKLIEMVLASFCLAIKFPLLDFERAANHGGVGIVYLAAMTYVGYWYLIVVCVRITLKNLRLKKCTSMYYYILGALLYVSSELLFLWTTWSLDLTSLISFIAALILAAVLVLDAIGQICGVLVVDKIRLTIVP